MHVYCKNKTRSGSQGVVRGCNFATLPTFLHTRVWFLGVWVINRHREEENLLYLRHIISQLCIQVHHMHLGTYCVYAHTQTHTDAHTDDDRQHKAKWNRICLLPSFLQERQCALPHPSLPKIRVPLWSVAPWWGRPAPCCLLSPVCSSSPTWLMSWGCWPTSKL